MASRSLCIVTHTFLPHIGGIERVVYEQSKRLMRFGFDVTVLTSRMNTPERYVVDGIKVRCYDSLNAAFGLGIPYPIPHINSFEPFYKCVNQSDLVHVHGHPYLSSLYAARLAKFAGKPVVLTQHNTFIAYAGKLWDHVEWLNDAAVGMQVLRSADRIITVSNATKRYVLNLGADPTRLNVLHNGVDVDRFRPAKLVRDEKRRQLGIPTNATVILTVRRLVYKNGIDTLIESAKTVLQQDPNMVFVAVGTGPDRDAVQARIKQMGITDRFRLAGFVSDAELPSFYNAADLFVLPSKSGEGLPLVSLEAMACGLPVVATDVGGIREIIPEAYGKFVPPDSPTAMAEAVLEASRSNLAELRQKLRTMVEEQFSWETNVERLSEIYEQLI
jgi:glycosyltransferase involved in cell wall biosynthesis